MGYLILMLVSVIAIVVIFMLNFRRITIYEYEKGLKYSKGKFTEIIDSGQYWYLPVFTKIQKIDIRPCFVSITGQEVLSSDGVTLKVSLAAKYEIADLNTAINKVQNYQEALYLELQLALREIIGSSTIDSVLQNRDKIAEQLMELRKKGIEEIGLNLLSVNLKDIMFPGQLKQIFAQVVKARKEGEAALEKARGETAALRNLANAAKMLESNPNLMQLRIIQSIGESSGNTIVLGMPSHSSTIPIKTKDIDSSKTDKIPEDTQNES